MGLIHNQEVSPHCLAIFICVEALHALETWRQIVLSSQNETSSSSQRSSILPSLSNSRRLMVLSSRRIGHIKETREDKIHL